MTKALDLFRALSRNGFEPDMRSYHLMLQACTAAKDGSTAVWIAREIVADPRTFIQLDCDCVQSVLASCQHDDPNKVIGPPGDGVPLWQAALALVDRSTINNNFIPNRIAHEQIIQLCCRGEQLEQALSYAANTMDLGRALSTKTIDQMLILSRKKARNSPDLLQMLNERATGEIVFSKRPETSKDNDAKNAQLIIDRCMRHSVILSGHTYGSAMLRMCEGGRMKESLALLQSVLKMDTCEAQKAQHLPSPRKLSAMWRACYKVRELRKRSIVAFVLLHKQCLQQVRLNKSNSLRTDYFHGSLYWEIVCKCTHPFELFTMVEGLPFMGEIMHRDKMILALDKATTVCSDRTQLEFVIRYMRELGQSMGPKKIAKLVAAFDKEKPEDMLKFMQFLVDSTHAFPALFSVALQVILASKSADCWRHAHALDSMARAYAPEPDPKLLTQLATVYAQSNRWTNVLSLVHHMQSVGVPRSLEFYSTVLQNKKHPGRPVPRSIIATMTADADTHCGFSWREVTEHFSCHDDLAAELVRMLELRQLYHKDNCITSHALIEDKQEAHCVPVRTERYMQNGIPSVLYTNSLSMSYLFESLKVTTDPSTV